MVVNLEWTCDSAKASVRLADNQATRKFNPPGEKLLRVELHGYGSCDCCTVFAWFAFAWFFADLLSRVNRTVHMRTRNAVPAPFFGSTFLFFTPMNFYVLFGDC